MRFGGQNPGIFSSLITLLILLLALLGAFLFGRGQSHRGLQTLFEETLKKGQLVSDMQTKLLASVEAEKSAVMADTDEGSEAFAAETRRLSAAVEANRRELGRLIEMGKRSVEVARFQDFSNCWEKYQVVDREILDLAVQNTNLKALKLSFIPASTALDRMQAALDRLVDDSAASAEAAIIAPAVYRTLAAALKLHALESRHIAEARNEEMDRIEVEMQTLDRQVSHGLHSLTALTGQAAQAAVDEAQAAYADFQKVHAEVVTLSRQNSNVRSFAISLGQKRKVTAECQDLLHALQESIRSERRMPTR